jgi:hypothetical protein
MLQIPSSCRADLIPFNFLPGGPTFTSAAGTLTYNATTGEYQVSSPALTLNASYLPRGFATITGGTISTDLFVDQNGNFASNGTGLVITGTVTVNGKVISGPTAADPLLRGTITAFGSQAPGPPTLTMNSLFRVSGGELTVPGTSPNPSIAVFPLNSPGGIIINAENVTSGILGNYSQNFSSSSAKLTPGSIPVPEPGAWALGLLATAGVVGWSRLRSRGARSGPEVDASA